MTSIKCVDHRHNTYPMASDKDRKGTIKHNKGAISSKWVLKHPNGFSRTYHIVVIHGKRPKTEGNGSGCSIAETGRLTDKSKYNTPGSTTGTYTSFIALNDQDYKFSKSVDYIVPLETERLFDMIINVFHDMNSDLRPTKEEEIINPDWQEYVTNYLREYIVPIFENEAISSKSYTCTTIKNCALVAFAALTIGALGTIIGNSMS